MERLIQLRHLAEAEHHISHGERNIADQELRIVELRHGGHDVRLAQTVLATFLQTQDQFIRHREEILKVLSE